MGGAGDGPKLARGARFHRTADLDDGLEPLQAANFTVVAGGVYTQAARVGDAYCLFVEIGNTQNFWMPSFERVAKQVSEELVAEPTPADNGNIGVGKSSLVRAGMIAELHGGTMTPAGSTWEVMPPPPIFSQCYDFDLLDEEDLIEIDDPDNPGKKKKVPPTGWKKDEMFHVPVILPMPDQETDKKYFSTSLGNVRTIEERAENIGMFYWIESE